MILISNSPAPNDYIDVTITTIFSPGTEDRFCLNISVIEDQNVESEEFFLLNLYVGSLDDTMDQRIVTVLDSTGKSIDGTELGIVV